MLVLDKQHFSLVMFVINHLDLLGHSGWEKNGKHIQKYSPNDGFMVIYSGRIRKKKHQLNKHKITFSKPNNRCFCLHLSHGPLLASKYGRGRLTTPNTHHETLVVTKRRKICGIHWHTIPETLCLQINLIKLHLYKSHRIHVWYVYLHLP